MALVCATYLGSACSDGSNGSFGDGGTRDASSAGQARDASTPVEPLKFQCKFSDADQNLCASDHYKTGWSGLDIYVMFDQSGSMSSKDDGTNQRLDQVRRAVRQFLTDPNSVGVGVGIGYFGQHPLPCACTSCEPSAYATPSVVIGSLPDNAAAVMASLDAIAPTGETPTGAAIRGACTYAKSWKQGHAAHKVVILLVTDGEPKAPLTDKAMCNPTLADAVAASSGCAAPGSDIQTYVLGVGPSLENLNQIAMAGGTGKAYLAAAGGSAEILEALNTIRNDAIPCGLKIPFKAGAGLLPNFSSTRVVQANHACTQYAIVTPVATEAACHPQNGGWYYDNAAAPKQIRLCPVTCEQAAAPGQELSVSMECKGQVVN